jgi:hypothetical protein
VTQLILNVWDNAAMESFFSSLKTERTGRKTYRTRDEARADVFDYIERFYNPKRRLSFPKIRSGRIRAVRENQTIIQCDVCDHPSAWNIYRRSAQVAAPA